MEHLLTNVTGLDVALCLALLCAYIWSGTTSSNRGEGLDTGTSD